MGQLFGYSFEDQEEDWSYTKLFVFVKPLTQKQSNCLLTYFDKGSHGWMCHGWVCIFVFFLSNFKKEKYRIKWGVSVSGMTYVREVLRSFVMMWGRGGGGEGVKKKGSFRVTYLSNIPWGLFLNRVLCNSICNIQVFWQQEMVRG